MIMKEEITRCDKCGYIIRRDYIMGPMRKGSLYVCICKEVRKLHDYF
jgi:hypothetical protein